MQSQSPFPIILDFLYPITNYHIPITKTWDFVVLSALAFLFLFKILFFKFIFNWKIISNCVGFCHTTTCITQKYTYTSSVLKLPPTHHPYTTLYVVTGLQAELPVLYANFSLAIYFTPGSVYVSMLLSQFIPPSPSPAMSTSPSSTSASLFWPWKQVHALVFWSKNILGQSLIISKSY